MGAGAPQGRRRVFVPHALGADEFLRATWHPSRDVVVVSHWRAADCIAATPIRTRDLAELASLIDEASAAAERSAWPPPEPSQLVVPAGGFVTPASQRIA